MARVRGVKALRISVALSMAAAALAACGGGGSTASRPETDPEVFEVGFKNGAESAGDPVDGGSFTFGEWVQPPSLDPVKYYVTGAVGGTEFAAVYDPLLRYDPVSGEYEPQMAKSVEPNGDFTEWALTLREGVEFTDGTPFDAEAVKFNIDRVVAAKASNYDFINEYIESMDVSDPGKVVFKLKKPWPGFEFLLASNVGYIGSPTAIKKDENGYSTKPVAAGPFMVESYVAGDSIVLKANPDYWDGKPHLDSVKFVPVAGDADRWGQLTNHDIDAAFFRDFEYGQKAVDAGYPGFMNLSNGGWALAINNAEGRAGSDVRVRQAIAYAIDPEVLKQRFLNGYGVAGKDLFLPWSKWSSDVKGLAHDPEAAKKLLAEAKADGYDGKLVMPYSAGTADNYALAVQAMLNSVGFDVEIEPSATLPEQQTRLYVNRDYDIAPTAMDMGDGGVLTLMTRTFFGQAAYLGVADGLDEWSALLDEYAVAESDEQKQAVAAKMQEHWNETVPMVPTSAVSKYVAWDESIHGLEPTIDDIMLIGNAWREQ